jgi:hydrogenase maturation protein HypF
VRNDAEGVLIEVQGVRAAEFLPALQCASPPLARITEVLAEWVTPVAAEEGFLILASAEGPVSTSAAPDVCVCPACLAEMCDPADRRWGYPFLNCTECGPRFTIIRRLPYDRPNTALAAFPLCAACRAEYENPADRRFHAQPIACPDCGPKLSHSVAEVLAALRDGRIVALKALGGFQLLCDATSEEVVTRLRERKGREAKPFALMALNVASARRWVEIGPAEQASLQSPERPIVLLTRKGGLPEVLAPGLATLGVMLPVAPLQFLLFHEAVGRPAGTGWLEQACDLLLVATSANPGGEPLVIDDAEARARLCSIADLIVTHDRPIVTRCDDSVVRIIAGKPRFLRRARGFTPRAIALARPVPPVLALGGALKATVCATRGTEAVLSQHVGTLENVPTLRFLEEAARHLLHLLDLSPVLLAHDLHPDAPARRLIERLALPALAVQHHHAHAAAVLAEHCVTEPALAVVLDGFGLGSDGGAWGGELLRLDGATYRRLGHLRPLPLPGGDMAAREPWRMGVAALHALGRSGEICRRFGAAAAPLARLLAAGRVAPTTSCGRLFDAAAALLGVIHGSRYEGEGAMRLEALARVPRVLAGGWRLDGLVLDLLPLLAHLCGCSPAEGAELFHGTLAEGIVAWARAAAEQENLRTIALGGGCFINRALAEGVAGALQEAGLRPLLPLEAPPGDGGLSLGQAWIAALTVA